MFLPNDGTNKGSPKIVDGLGQERQIDAAKKAGIGHLVMVGTMGTTTVVTPGAMPDELRDCFKYKRHSEDYLLASGLTYTIVNPCALVDGEEGTRELVFSKSDKLYGSSTYKVARKSLAEVILQTMLVPEAKNKAFDVLAHVEKPPTGPFDYVTAFKEATPECTLSLINFFEHVV